MHHPTAPVCALCGHSGKLVEEDHGYIVTCTNKYCEGVPSLCDREATLTKDAAWSLWVYKQTGVCR